MKHGWLGNLRFKDGFPINIKMPILRDFLLRWIFHYRRLRLTNRVSFDFVAKLGFNRTALIFHGVFFGGLLRLRTRPFANVWRKSMCRLLGSGLPANSTAVIFMKFHEYPKQVSQPILIAVTGQGNPCTNSCTWKAFGIGRMSFPWRWTMKLCRHAQHCGIFMFSSSWWCG